MTEDYDCITVALYARVSTDDKDQNPETQIRELREFCRLNGYTVADKGAAVYTDEVSGKAWKENGDKIAREGLERLKGRISRGDIDYVLARSQDRLSRNVEEYESLKRQFWTFSGKKTRVRFSSTDVKPETYGGTVMDALQASMGQAENMKRSIETKKGQLTAKLQGRHVNRFLAVCMDTDVERNRNRIHMPGDVCRRTGEPVKQVTVILTKDAIMDCAKAGMSMLRASQVLGVGRTSFYNLLLEKDLMGEYKSYQKQSLPKAVGDLYTEGQNEGVSEITERGTPSGNGGTADGKGAAE